MADRPNRPVPDELDDVRQQIKALRKREDGLKHILLTQPDARTGASWAAEIRVTERKEIDWEAIALYPEIIQVIADNTHPKPVTSVVLVGISEDGELVNARKFRKETAQ